MSVIGTDASKSTYKCVADDERSQLHVCVDNLDPIEGIPDFVENDKVEFCDTYWAKIASTNSPDDGFKDEKVDDKMGILGSNDHLQVGDINNESMDAEISDFAKYLEDTLMEDSSETFELETDVNCSESSSTNCGSEVCSSYDIGYLEGAPPSTTSLDLCKEGVELSLDDRLEQALSDGNFFYDDYSFLSEFW